jgi:membrane peptidoglycan carboxypeptidase
VAGKPTTPNPWPILAKLLGTLVVCGVLAAGVALPLVGGIGLAAKHEADKFNNTTCNLQETQPPEPSTIYASNGTTVIARLFTQDRQPVALSKVPKYLIQALIATEDRRFYSHHGVDMRGLIRSAVSTSGGDTQGGSTLTMQYVKQVRYYQDIGNQAAQLADIEQNLNRKIEDAKCAIAIEKRESKDTILDNYLNIAFFGENAYSIESAAQTYFGVDVNKLTLAQSALLVGLLQAPTEYDPFQNPQAAKDRRNQVIQNLVAVGNLTQAQANKEEVIPVSLATTRPPVVRRGCANAPDNVTNVGFFCDYAVNWLIQNKVATESQLDTGGLKIVTTLSATLQNSMQKNLDAAMPATSPMTAIMPVVDPHTGDILAMATSKKYGSPTSAKDNTHTSLPIFTSYTAQGASTYKLFPLLTALSTGVPSTWPIQTPEDGYKWTACDLSDTTDKVTDTDETTIPGRDETLSEAVAQSSNTYFVGIADQLLGCNLQPIINMATSLGVHSLSQPIPGSRLTVAQEIVADSNATELVLGDIGTSPLEMAGAYAGVANEGRFNAPAPILSVTDSSGRIRQIPRSPGVQVVSPQVALQAVQLLEGDTKSSIGTSAEPFSQLWYNKNSSLVAGKTGTSVAVNSKGDATDENSAVWFVGMTPSLVAATAVINLDHPNYAASGLPGLSDPGLDAYGKYASGLWLKTLEPTLVSEHWTWADPGSVPGESVPNVVGEDYTTAKAHLASAGYTTAELGGTLAPVSCPSTIAGGSVAFYGPEIAQKGATITVCISSGAEQVVYHAPPPPPPRTKAPPSGAPSSGSSGPGSGGGIVSTGSASSGPSSTSSGTGPSSHHHNHGGG